MNVSHRWLADLVPGLDLDPEALAEHLALRGAPVEGMDSPGAALKDVVVGRVVSTGPHPDADRLSLCTVEAGDGPVQVVCGAPNVAEGGLYPFAPVGAVLPDGTEIRIAEIRGQESVGMLCSARELGLGADHSGLLELDGDLEPGTPFVGAYGLDDTTLDVEITANRGDLLSHAGVARELASEGQGEVRLPDIPGDPGVSLEYLEGDPEASAGGVSVRIEDPDLCHRYLGAVIRGVEIGPSPEWLQVRLRGAGARPINNVVDATNYVMLELGQPLHAFDLERLEDSSIVVRRAAEDEREFVTLDDEERRLTPQMLMICDAARPVAIAGVMGGQDSEVDAETTDILLECALFQPASIRNTRRALVMSTDASYRFERGVDPEGMRRAVERAVALILATAGGQVDGPVLDAHCRRFEADVVPLRLSRIEYLLGVPFEAGRVVELLTPLGFEVVGREEGTLQVRVPGYRSYDVTREVDLIEEVARTHGYDQFPAELEPHRLGTVPDDPMFGLQDELRDELVGRGFFESQTPAFVPEGEGDVKVSNPLNTREPYVRKALLPSLLRRVEYNFARGTRDVRLFEIGTSFRMVEKGEAPEEQIHLAAVLTGRREPPHWSVEDEPFQVWDVKDVLEEVARRAYRGQAAVRPLQGEHPLFEPGMTLMVIDGNGDAVGGGGLVRPSLVDAPAWADAVWAVEVTLPDPVPAKPTVTYDELPQHPAVERDLALVVSDEVAGGDVLALVRATAGDFLEALDVFDVYRGKGIPEGTRSLAVRLRFRAPDRTLKDEEVDRTMASVLTRLKEDLGVEHRG